MIRITLHLPEPDSPNQAPQHPMERVRWKNGIKWRTWKAAIQQEKPVTDPPDPVLVTAHFRLWNLRDEDNLAGGSLKWVLDALRLPREADDVSWRRGLYERKGYITDDSPDHMTLGEVTQEIDRSNRGLTLSILDLEKLDELAETVRTA